MRRSLARLGGMVVAPVETLSGMLQGAPADALEPILLAILTVAATYPLTVARLAWTAEVSWMTAFSRLFSSSGFIWGRLLNEMLVCGVAAAGWAALQLWRRQALSLLQTASAALYLYVPMALLVLVGGVLARLGLDWAWLPSHPLDGAWVVEGGRIHWDRLVLKWLVEMAWPVGVALAVAARLVRRPPASPGAAPLA